MILDIVSVFHTSLNSRYWKYVQLGLGALAALVVNECHGMQKYLQSSSFFVFLLCFLDSWWRRFLLTPLPHWGMIRFDVTKVFIPSLSRLLAESWNDLPSVVSEATFIACWPRNFAPLAKKGRVLLNNSPRILSRPWPLCLACTVEDWHLSSALPRIIVFVKRSARIATKWFPHYDKKYGLRLRRKCSVATTTELKGHWMPRVVPYMYFQNVKLFLRDWYILRRRIQSMNQITKISGCINHA